MANVVPIQKWTAPNDPNPGTIYDTKEEAEVVELRALITAVLTANFSIASGTYNTLLNEIEASGENGYGFADLCLQLEVAAAKVAAQQA